MFEIIISFFLGLFIGAMSAWLVLKNRSKTKRERSKPDSDNSVLASNTIDDQHTLGYETNLAWKTEQSVFNQVTGQAAPQVPPQIIEVGHPPLSEVQLELQRLNAKLTEREKVFYPDEDALLQAEQDKLANAESARLVPPVTVTRLNPILPETHNTQANEFEIASLASSMQESAPPLAGHFDPSELEAIALDSAQFDGIDFDNEEQDSQDPALAAAAQAETAIAQEAEQGARQEAEAEQLAQQEALHQARLLAEQLAETAKAEAQRQAQLAVEQAQRLEQERATLAAQLEAEHAAHLEAQRVAQENARVAAAALLALETARQEAEQAAAEVERLEQERLREAEQRRAQQEAEQAAQLQAQLEAQLQAQLEAQLQAEQAAQLEEQRVAQENAKAEAQAKLAAEQAALAKQLEQEKVQAQLAAQAAAKAAALLEQQKIEQAAAAQAQEKAAQEELTRIENQRLEAQRLAEQTAAALQEPARQAQLAPLSAEPGLGTTPPSAVKTPENTMIMVADDSKVVRIKISRALTKCNYQITLAENGIEAADKIAEARPDVLITDVEMPGMDGFGLTQQLRSNPDTMHLPIIMISGASHELVDKAKQAGIDVLLGKPYSDDELIGHIQRLLLR